MKTTRNFNRKIVTAITRADLLIKIQDSETRAWQVLNEITQHTNGHWACVMERR